MKNDIVRLTKKDLTKIITKRKVIGKGTEGTCYKIGKEVYKIYHNIYRNTYFGLKAQYDESGVRIYRSSDINIYKNRQTILQYKDNEGVTLGVEVALTRAINKGLKVVGTRLPTKIITVRNKVRGCVYPYHKNTKSIYKAFHKKYETRLKICKSLIDKVNELLDNNIYPVDLCNKNKNRLFDKNDNNVLLGRKNEPIIVDLEGRSTLYTDSINYELLSKSYYTLLLLVLELLTKEILTIQMDEGEVDEVYSILDRFGLDKNTIDNIVNDKVSREDVEQVMNIAKSKVKCKHKLSGLFT